MLGYRDHLLVLRFLDEGEPQTFPFVLQCINEIYKILLSVKRSRGDPNPFGALGYSRVVDGLQIDPVVLEKAVGELTAFDGISNNNRDDVARIVHDW